MIRFGVRVQVDLDEEEGLRILRRRDQRVQTRVASGRPGQVSGHVSGHVSGDYGSGVVSSYRRSARASHARPALAEGNGDTKDSFGGGPKSATIVKGAGGLHEGVLSGHGHVAANAPEVMALVPLHQHIVLILLDLVDLRPQVGCSTVKERRFSDFYLEFGFSIVFADVPQCASD